ncbi:hypothetical protein KDL01_13275 [Actinospica durhamensis]|uniref:DUF2470 domain-containing protein n=1 Tax=Actinospica durhamensis TaxID=1508375 RepID=A0A941IMJ4_9ACTN|nr:hypothetical protein [Actinospica durhamensis]MBR7834240.1 hypothetical protein [Actinospica durhamensis]
MTNRHGPVLPQPLQAMRVRTLASTARVTGVETLADGRTVSVPGAVTERGCLVVLVQPGSPLHTALLDGQRFDGQEDVAARVTLQVHREVGGHSLVRATLGACGWLSALPETQLRAAAVTIAEQCPDETLFTALEHVGDPQAPVIAELDLASIDFDTLDARGVVDVDEYLAAGVDPLAGVAEGIIEHINDGHADLIAPCLAMMLAKPVRTAWLWELDSESIGFLAELPDMAGPAVVTLPWPHPIRDPAVLDLALHSLFVQGRCPDVQP